MLPDKRRIVIAVMLALAPVALADDPFDKLGAGDLPSLHRPPRGSLARQRLVMLQLQRAAGGPLATALNHNRNEWMRLTPDLRDQYRRKFLAFRSKSPAEQAQLLQRYEKLFEMSAERRQAYRRRAKWLKVVVASFTPEQRGELARMEPDDRARRILARKAELIRQGKLHATTQTSR